MATQDNGRLIGMTFQLRAAEAAEIRILADLDCRSTSSWIRAAVLKALSQEMASADRRHGANRGD